MGASRWSDDDYVSYAATTSYVTKSRQELFKSFLDEKLDPRNVKVGKGPRKGLQLRESIISEPNPNPTPIILALDVTGSMGAVAQRIAQIELPKVMTQIHETRVVSDPHVMFMGFDDVHASRQPGVLQVSYFEPDLKIVEQLQKLWLVNNGGGNGSESYDLPWYFAAHHTYLESYEVQGRKGFLFTFGDEPAPYETLTPHDLEVVFGPGDYETTTPASSLKAAQEKFQVFHVHVEHGGSGQRERKSWTELMGNNVIFLRNTEYLTDVVIATMAIANGANINEVIKNSRVPAELKYAFSNSLKG